ncbi:MAG: phosphotransferase [Bifidobacteriaceae bacterium]|nr:phosphotransferase [Bifidobacteriaceae bacterium]
MTDVTSLVDDLDAGPSLHDFAKLSKGDPAPYWLFRGVCAAWGIEASSARIDLITVSENATFVLYINGKREGVVRVSQPGYVGGPEAVASELSWLAALHDVDDVSLIDPVPTVRGTFVASIRDFRGSVWTVISTKFVEGTVLEDLGDPAEYYQTIGTWAAKFHNQARHWKPPFNFKRFTWNTTDMVGQSPRWGRWENADLSPDDRAACDEALARALSVVRRYPVNERTWGIIHADLRPSNIIRRPDGRLTVIDFDDCGYSYYLYDYASSLSFVEHEPYAPAMAQSWARGYQQITPLTEQDFDLMSALSMIRRMQMLGWTITHRKDALPDGLADQQAPGSVLCARRYLDDPRWLLHEGEGVEPLG